ncbi:MotA/TolQ/ExbB proton channel family protein [bacterium]|nr:MotA/TolQ/ExbB proton channel family protein [bacterium]
MSEQSDRRGLLWFFYMGRMDVHIGMCGLLGVVLSAIFYFVFPLPFLKPGYIFNLFASRGWVPYGITILFFWGLIVLIVKSLGMRRERACLVGDPMAKLGLDKITPGIACKVLPKFEALADVRGATVLPNRIHRMLGQFGTTSNKDAMENALRQEVEIDEARLASSYVMLKVFIWAIPILGFIGTVIGIVQAVSGFASFVDSSVADIAEIKGGLGLVTSGLSVAFETTLLALVISLIMMIPMSALQKQEENLLLSFDRYCIDNVLSKARIKKIETPTPESAILSKVLEMSMRNQMEILEQFKSSFISALRDEGEAFSKTVSAYTDSQKSGLLEYARIAESAAGQFTHLRVTAGEMNKSVAAATAEASRQISEAFEKNIEALAGEREAAHKEASKLIGAIQEAASACLSSTKSLQSGFETKVDAFTAAVARQQEAAELLNAANRNLELLTSTKEVIGVLESLKTQLAALTPAVERFARPRTIRVVEEQKS